MDLLKVDDTFYSLTNFLEFKYLMGIVQILVILNSFDGKKIENVVIYYGNLSVLARISQ